MSKQITVTVKTERNKNERKLLHETGNTLLQTIREGGIALPSLCDGIGKCGRCSVRFEGYAPLPTQPDRRAFSPDQLREGFRLACMARPVKDCTVETAFGEDAGIDVVTAAYVNHMTDDRTEIRLSCDKKMPDSHYGTAEAQGMTGGQTIAAVDIGTTTIAMELLEPVSGRIVDIYTALNPQRSYGADIIARIRACNEGRADMLRRLVENVLEAGLEQFDKTAEQRKLCKPNTIVIACNTAMGHIFMGYPVETLGRSPFLPVTIQTVETQFCGRRTWLAPGISTFVGGDIVAGLYAAGLCPEKQQTQAAEESWLFLDLGTNAEMVMGSGGRIACTAAASGPAFEGGKNSAASGSDRIYAIAQFLEQGMIDETGLLAEPYFETGIESRVKQTGERFLLTQEDIRNIQTAKAAVRTGISFLMESLGISDCSRIGKVYAAGGFGFYLDESAAIRTGLLPETFKGKFCAVGNTSLAGAAMIGRLLALEKDNHISSEEKIFGQLEEYAQEAEVFNLAEKDGFQQRYLSFINF